MKLYILALAMALLIGFASGAELEISWKQVANMSINVRDYGAVGDNSTDNSAAIQSALNVAMSDHTPVYFPGGMYVIDSPLFINQTGGIKIFGNGRALGDQDGKSVIRYTGTGPGIYINTSTPDEFIYSVEFADIVFWGNVTNNGTYIDHLSESLFSRVTWYNFATAIDVDMVDITTFSDCVISECTNGFWNDEIRAATFQGWNVWDTVTAFRFNDVYSTNIILSHFEKFNDSVLIQNTEGDSDIKGLVIAHNHLLNGDDMNIDSRVVRLSATHASNKFSIDNMVLENNYAQLYDSSHVIEVDISGTSGFCYGYTVLDSNKIEYIGTAFVATDNTNFRWTAMNNRMYLDKPILVGDYDTQLGGFSQVYADFRVFGPMRLDNQTGDQAGDVWYDTSTNKLKFYNGAAVETVTSST